MIRAVIFDVGGPLDTEVAFEAAIDADIRSALACEGYIVDDAAYAEQNTDQIKQCVSTSDRHESNWL